MIILARINGNGLSRLETRFDEAERIDALKTQIGEPMEADDADENGLVTHDIDLISIGRMKSASSLKNAQAFLLTR